MKLRVSVPCSTLFPGAGDRLREFCDTVEYKRTDGPELTGLRELFHWSEGIFADNFIEEIERTGLQDFFHRHLIEEFSFDLGPATGLIRAEREPWGEYFMPESPPLTIVAMERLLHERVDYIRRWYQGRIAVELYGYYPTGAYLGICDPDLVSRLLESADIYLLLDLGHAEVSASNLSLPLHAYLERLPLHRVSHIHLSKPGYMRQEQLPTLLCPDVGGGITIDAHGMPDDSDIASALQIASRSELDEVFVAIEHYKDLNGLFIAYRTLREQIDNWNGI